MRFAAPASTPQTAEAHKHMRHSRTFKTLAPLALWTVAQLSMAASGDGACGMLAGAGGSGASAASGASNTAAASAPRGFALRDGEPVDFIAGGKTVHGTLHVLTDGSIYRAYWQPEGRAERYVLANAGSDAVRLIAAPPQGAPAANGMPGTTVGPQQVLSCPGF